MENKEEKYLNITPIYDYDWGDILIEIRNKESNLIVDQLQFVFKIIESYLYKFLD